LRAVIQNNNDNFAKTLSRSGHRRHISDSSTTPLHTGIPITRDAFIEHKGFATQKSRNSMSDFSERRHLSLLYGFWDWYYFIWSDYLLR
jgi:hypothetical protein